MSSFDEACLVYIYKKGSRSVNLVARILAYNFRSTLRREIGLKICGVVGSFPGLGRATTATFNISSGNEEEEAASLQRSLR